MHPAFASLQFGPFESAFHRGTVDDAFKERLSAYLEAVILPQVIEPFTSTRGQLTALYDSDLNAGPNSAVRNLYRLKLAFCRPSGDDTLEAELKVDPATGHFSPRRPHQELCVFTAWHRLRAQAIDALCVRVAIGEAVDEPCPQCDATLTITVSPSLRAAACPEGCFDFDRHLDPKTGDFAHGHAFFRPRLVSH